MKWHTRSFGFKDVLQRANDYLDGELPHCTAHGIADEIILASGDDDFYTAIAKRCIRESWDVAYISGIGYGALYGTQEQYDGYVAYKTVSTQYALSLSALRSVKSHKDYLDLLEELSFEGNTFLREKALQLALHKMPITHALLDVADRFSEQGNTGIQVLKGAAHWTYLYLSQISTQYMCLSQIPNLAPLDKFGEFGWFYPPLELDGKTLAGCVESNLVYNSMQILEHALLFGVLLPGTARKIHDSALDDLQLFKDIEAVHAQNVLHVIKSPYFSNLSLLPLHDSRYVEYLKRKVCIFGSQFAQRKGILSPEELEDYLSQDLTLQMEMAPEILGRATQSR